MPNIRLYRVGVIDGLLRGQPTVLISYYATLATSPHEAVQAVAEERPLVPQDTLFAEELDGRTALMPTERRNTEQLRDLKSGKELFSAADLKKQPI
jgi:hypothetical protein